MIYGGKVHELKTHPEPYNQVALGIKTYEVRVDDRDFCTGDLLALHEWSPYKERYTGRAALVEVTHKTPGGEWGLPKDRCVMAIRVLTIAVNAHRGYWGATGGDH